jgi:hypothetical protein
MNRRTATIAILVALALASFAALAGNAAPAEGNARAAARPVIFDVTLSGSVSGRPFSRSAVMLFARTVDRVATTNGVNRAEMCLASGFPAGRPETGAIRYGTNSACFRSRGASIDTSYVTVTGSTYIARPDPRLTSTYLNTFTSSPGIASSIFSAQSGSIALRFGRGGTIRGTIALHGYCGGLCGETDYFARVSGRVR